MKLNHLLSLAVLVGMAVNANANPANTLASKLASNPATTAAAAANRSSETAYEQSSTPWQSTKTRAEVSAEAPAASVMLSIPRGDAFDVPYQATLRSTVTRAQVRAEALEARHLDLLSHGDVDARLPTAGELEAVRMAGQRALGKQVSQQSGAATLR